MKKIKEHKIENIFEQKRKDKILYCHNNDKTSIEEVVALFNLYLGYNIPVAVNLAYLINDEKKLAIYKDSRENLEKLKKIFLKKGLKMSIEE